MSGIVRGPRSNFTILDNATLRDSRLSYRARGILGRLLSNMEGYSMTSNDLAAEGREGRDAIQTALRELRKVGYLITKRIQNPNGTWVTINIINETPEPDYQASAKPKPENQASVFRASVNQALNTDKTKNNTKSPPPPPEKKLEGKDYEQRDWPPTLADEDRRQVVKKMPSNLSATQLQAALDEYRAAIAAGRSISAPARWILAAAVSKETTPNGRAYGESRKVRVLPC